MTQRRGCRRTGVGGGGAVEARSTRELALSASVVAGAMSGRLVSGRPDDPVRGLSIDSRTLVPGDLFVAIRGERFDGHAFLDAARAAGAVGAVVASLPPGATDAWPPHSVFILVEDTTRALQALARYVRQVSGSQVVAVTGSTGKTTTKEITAALLALKYRVIRSTGNLNNHIGVPLSLLQLQRRPEIAVVELGMSHAGELGRLVAIAEPDVRVWTNVADVHAEFFASIEAIADAKAEVLQGATPRTLLVANADDPLVMARVQGFAGSVSTFGTSAAADVSASAVEDLGLDGMAATVRTTAGTTRLRTPLLGRGNLANVLAATAVAVRYDIPLAQVAERVATLQPPAHRGVVVRLAGGVTLVDDSYNSNPRALEAALDVVSRERHCGRRVAVLGEMLELGARSAALHAGCGRAAAAAGLDLLVTVGGDPARALGTAAIGAGMREGAVFHEPTSEAAVTRIAGLVRPGDLVLVKGSRGIRTDLVVDRLMAEFG